LDNVIVEELIRSIAFFFLFYMLTIIVGSLFFQSSSVSPNFILIPISLTLITFSSFIHKRRNTGKEYHLRRGSFEYKVMIGSVSICCLFVVLSGVTKINDRNLLVGLIWFCLGILLGISGLIEFRRKN